MKIGHKPNAAPLNHYRRTHAKEIRMIKPSQRIDNLLANSIFTEITLLGRKHGAIDIGHGFPDFPALDFIKAAATSAVANDINQYTFPRGRVRLRQALARRMVESGRMPHVQLFPVISFPIDPFPAQNRLKAVKSGKVAHENKTIALCRERHPFRRHGPQLSRLGRPSGTGPAQAPRPDPPPGGPAPGRRLDCSRLETARRRRQGGGLSCPAPGRRFRDLAGRGHGHGAGNHPLQPTARHPPGIPGRGRQQGGRGRAEQWGVGDVVRGANRIDRGFIDAVVSCCVLHGL